MNPSLNLSLTESLTHWIIHSPNFSLTESLIHWITHWITHSPNYSLTESLIHSLNHSVTESLSNTLTESITHWITNSLNHSLTEFWTPQNFFIGRWLEFWLFFFSEFRVQYHTILTFCLEWLVYMSKFSFFSCPQIKKKVIVTFHLTSFLTTARLYLTTPFVSRNSEKKSLNCEIKCHNSIFFKPRIRNNHP